MRLLILFVLALSLRADDKPCLSGQGPLQSGQHYCNFFTGDGPAAPEFSPPYIGPIESWAINSITTWNPTQYTVTDGALSDQIQWTFTKGSETLQIDGALLFELVKSRAK